MSALLYIEETCTVCAEDFSVDRKMHNISCGHVFCRVCLDNLNPSLCPVCRKGFREVDVECVGPWESDPTITELDKWDEWQAAWNDAVQGGVDDHAWSPSGDELAEDLEVREELGLPRDRREEDWNRDAWTSPSDDRALGRVSIGPSPLPEADTQGWKPSDREHAEDSAAWEALMTQRQASISSSSALQRASPTPNVKGSFCIVC
ncbi:hypothetical protein PENSPDRAFT_753402 [Peniophora sp. CONT]|nr:hypothetical protein PENSPDRAFT_753402 [Peniophora sp. CONT]